DWPDTELTEAQYVTEILERTDALLLLDVENVYANARNLGGEPLRFIEQLPLERIAYVHVAGGVEREGLYHDTHAAAVPGAVLELLAALCARTTVPGVMLERDGDFPTEAQVHAELDASAASAGIRSRAPVKDVERRLADTRTGK